VILTPKSFALSTTTDLGREEKRRESLTGDSIRSRTVASPPAAAPVDGLADRRDVIGDPPFRGSVISARAPGTGEFCALAAARSWTWTAHGGSRTRRGRPT